MNSGQMSSASSAQVDASRKEVEAVAKLLSSKSSRDQLEGARKAVAAALSGDALVYREHFPAVVKAVALRAPDVKRLVYLFLSSTAERSPNDALLAVNALKTELDSQSALQRGMALRALSNMRVPVIRQLVVLACKKCAHDPDLYVRRCAAMASIKLATTYDANAVVFDNNETDQSRRLPSVCEPELLDVIQVLLHDSASSVVGSAVVAYSAICPDHWEIIHPVYRKVCRALVDMDAWTQVETLKMLLRYARKYFAKPPDDPIPGQERKDQASGSHERNDNDRNGNGHVDHRDDGSSMRRRDQEKTVITPVSIDKFYSDDDEDHVDRDVSEQKPASSEIEALSSININDDDDDDDDDDETGDGRQRDELQTLTESSNGAGNLEEQNGNATPISSEGVDGNDLEGKDDYEEPMQDDHLLLLRCARLILHSNNPSVVIAVASLMYHAAPSSEWIGVARSMMLAMRMSPHAAPIFLATIARWARDRPEMFKPFIRFFLIRSVDDRNVRSLKLEILTMIVDESNTPNLLKEFQSYLRDADKSFVADAVVALGRCAARLPSMSSPCMRALLRLSCYSPSVIADQAMMVMRVLAQSSPQQHAKGVAKVLRKIHKVKSKRARAEAIWMIGGLLPPPGYVVSGKTEKILKSLEIAAQRALFASAEYFCSESELGKIQMLNASSRLYLREPEKIKLLHGYILELAR